MATWTVCVGVLLAVLSAAVHSHGHTGAGSGTGGNDNRVVAHFDMNGIKGPLVLMKNETHVHVDASQLRFDAALGELTLDVHTLPVPTGMTRNPCDMIGDHFNPFESPVDLGDLSGSPGGTTLSSVTTEFTAQTNLTLVGFTGILGRSVALHVSNGDIVACANVIHGHGGGSSEPCGSLGSDLAHHTVEAVFHGAVSGRIQIRSLRVGPGNATSLFAHLFYTDNSPTSTGHLWHAHAGNVTTRGNCSTVGPVHETFAETHAAGMSPLHLLTVADRPSNLEGRQVRSAIISSGDLLSLVGRSIAIHQSTTDLTIIACANIRMIHPRTYVANVGTYGTVTVRQNGPLESVEVNADLTTNPSSLTINNYHVPQASSGMSCAATGHGGTFNPFNRTRVVRPEDRQTSDDYQAGDIHLKLGLTTGRGTACDSSISLFGANSAARRSVTFTRGGSSTCANLREQLGSGDSEIVAKATFLFSGAARGTVYLRQVRRYDGSLGLTTIESDGLSNTNGQTMRHYYWVHTNRKGYQASSVACGQSFTGMTYNPIGVSLTGTYTSECSPDNQLRCALGDTWRKTGTIDLDSGRILRQDSFMPVSGGYSVIGRSLVISDPNGGSARFACANIIPMSAQEIQIGVLVSRIPGGFNAADFERAVQQSSSAASGVSLLYSRSNVDVASGCVYITAAVDGQNAQMVAEQLSTTDLGSQYTQDRTVCTEGVSFAQSGAGTISLTMASLFLSFLVILFV